MKRKTSLKVLSLIMSVLTVFGVLCAGAFIMADTEKVTLPAVPSVGSGVRQYIAAANTAPNGVTSSHANDGLTADKPKLSWGAEQTGGTGVMALLKDGGTAIITGKGFVGAVFTFDNTKPIVITAKDGDADYRDYAVYADDTKKANGTQRGSFIASNPVTFAGDVIFRDVYFLARDMGISMTVASGSSLVVESSVSFYNMAELYGAEVSYNPALTVEEGAYAFLDAIGFSAYGGKGTIVLSDELISKVTADTFKGFGGKIVDKNGNVVLAAAEAVAGDEPTVSKTTVGYIANGSTAMVNGASVAASDSNNGTTPDKPKASWKKTTDTGVMSVVKDGGTIVSHGKGFISQAYSFPKTATPVLITAVYGGVDYRDGVMFNDEKTANGSQRGTLLLGDTTINVQFSGEYILDDIDIYTRLKKGEVAMTVAPGSKLVIGDGAKILTMSEGAGWEDCQAPTLVVDAGGVAYLHAVGFDSYKGGGIIVVGDEIASKVTAETFADFDGKIVDEDGKELFAASEPSTPTTPPTPSNPGTGDSMLVLVALAFVSLSACAAIVFKKRES